MFSSCRPTCGARVNSPDGVAQSDRRVEDPTGDAMLPRKSLPQLAPTGVGGPLAQAVAAFGGIGPELDRAASKGESPQDGALVPLEDLRKSARWLQQTITKFGATAAVSGPLDESVVEIATEVVQSCSAVVTTLLCMATRGACGILMSEIREMASILESAINELGQAVGKPEVARHAAKTLDRAKDLERIATNNRASIRKHLSKHLALLSDTQREIGKELKTVAQNRPQRGVAKPRDTDDDDESDVEEAIKPDGEMTPGEKRLVESVVVLIEAVRAVAEQGSRSCMPNSPSPSGGGTSAISELEAIALQVELASRAIESLAASAIGRLDATEFQANLVKTHSAVSTFFYYPTQSAAAKTAVDGVQTALEVMSPRK